MERKMPNGLMRVILFGALGFFIGAAILGWSFN